MEKDQYLTVTALTKYLHRKFSADPYLNRVYLTGEISNFRLRPRHQYFSLKDDGAKIDAVMFQSAFNKLKFNVEDGMKVLVVGRVDLYEPSGNYQITIEKMEPDGVGALYQAFEQLKTKLATEGLFSAPKRPLVHFPKRIAVITSPSGAVIRDIITTTRRRYPIAQLVLFPAVVQGEKAADSLVGRLKEVNARGDFDTIIIGRGGGSIEDLWPFNEEKVARAIFESQIPIISSVGHETDTTIADLVADVRAATPTAAAELATPVLEDEILRIKQDKLRLIQSYQAMLKLRRQRLQKLQNSYVFMQPNRLYEGYLQKLDGYQNRLKQAYREQLYQKEKSFSELMTRLQSSSPKDTINLHKQQVVQLKKDLFRATEKYVGDREQRLIKATNALDMLSPLRVMGRGFSYVTADEKIIKKTSDLTVGSEIKLHLSDGSVKAKVTKIDGMKKK
ncbi:exodeoxyribonuclease VII large subunit [Ligilactobacillus animalis]|uniref:Exodeoxyribonuclease 7 large subunit n=4 Tax=Ligilactobacillus TaxID=2767887 RepID=A0AAJ6FQ40_9LACO|nr:exodeoxyribonuclease VII large subunit [Ligilactobacillus animalis]KDA46123.1 exodeoxyribonuclease VII, large subunit, xseA [Ligilactobacillus animalis]KRM56962.1 exodeoxyribonuclease VII large subunit [Ligilactobacillus animalis KCTC 3501 = DSM 20602]MDO5884119.1 exodeoxyribonuclease VII large subunit [Ligilactobacillus animalis]MDQ2233760.1 exodeoxyribonuclease VII large subunit [Ligilactobacillus animalis]MDU1487970.1 exodeoxyribonuclease VII large subunit [Ligilactobacillus animalis]